MRWVTGPLNVSAAILVCGIDARLTYAARRVTGLRPKNTSERFIDPDKVNPT
jgi:hypothetical protein